jgi:hypothetical protein
VEGIEPYQAKLNSRTIECYWQMPCCSRILGEQQSAGAGPKAKRIRRSEASSQRNLMFFLSLHETVQPSGDLF